MLSAEYLCAINSHKTPKGQDSAQTAHSPLLITNHPLLAEAALRLP